MSLYVTKAKTVDWENHFGFTFIFKKFSMFSSFLFFKRFAVTFKGIMKTATHFSK